MEKLRKVSGILRLLVLISITVIVGYLLQGYFLENTLYTEKSALYIELWQNPTVDQSLLLTFKAPVFLAFLYGIYWLQKLLSFYQQGQFFGEQAMRCYIWLIWIKIAGFFLAIVETLVVATYYDSVLGNPIVELNVNFDELTTTLLMLIIVYLLKAAKDIEAENKEFI